MAADAVDPSSGLDEAIRDVDGVPLIEPDQGWIADDEATVVASEAVGDVGPLSAEESAVTIVSEEAAPGLTWGEGPGYVDDGTVDRPPGTGAGDPPAADS